MSDSPVQDADVLLEVEALWTQVFDYSNKVLFQAHVYGFLGIESIPRPNIHQRVVTLNLIGGLIAGALKDPAGLLSTSDIRLLLNAQKQIQNMVSLSEALKNGDTAGYDAAVAEIKAQASF